MQLTQQFNAQVIDPTQGGFSQLPVGIHPVVARSSEVKANNANTGGMVVFDLEVIDGPAKGQTGPLRINLYSSSDKARAIAEAQFSAICHATGQYLINDTAQLHNLPFAVRVSEQALTDDQKVKQANGETVKPFTQVDRILNPDGSEIKGGGGQHAPAPAPVQQAPAPAPQQAGAWGGGGGQGAQAGGWGGQQAQAPTQATAPAPVAGGWSQGASAGGKAAWGAK